MFKLSEKVILKTLGALKADIELKEAVAMLLQKALEDGLDNLPEKEHEKICELIELTIDLGKVNTYNYRMVYEKYKKDEIH